MEQRRQEEFEAILDHARNLRRPYDCAIPLSGGKDSTYSLYLCTKQYGLKCLAVTFDNGFLSAAAKRNVENAIKATDADLLIHNVNRRTSLDLYKLFLVKTGAFCPACMRGINCAIEAAVKAFAIPLVVKGSGRRVEYISQIPELATLHTASYVKNVLKGESVGKGFRYLFSDARTSEIQKMCGAMCDIVGLPRHRLMRFVPQYVALYDYIYKPYPEIIQILKQEMGWDDGGNTVEHLDCELHDIPQYMQTLKIPGVTKETFHNSGLIRQGLMTRDEAMAIETRNAANPEPPPELAELLRNIDVEYDSFVRCVKQGGAHKFEPKLGQVLRGIYHRHRKW